MRSGRLNVRLSADETAALAALAAVRGTTISAMVRGLLLQPSGPVDRAIEAAIACPPAAELIAVHERLSAAVYTHANSAAQLDTIGDREGAAQARARAEAHSAAADAVVTMVALARAAARVREVKP